LDPRFTGSNLAKDYVFLGAINIYIYIYRSKNYIDPNVRLAAGCGISHKVQNIYR
jgi:hypothetical protein